MRQEKAETSHKSPIFAILSGGALIPTFQVGKEENLRWMLGGNEFGWLVTLIGARAQSIQQAAAPKGDNCDDIEFGNVIDSWCAASRGDAEPVLQPVAKVFDGVACLV